jgi:3',5'-cyclic-AMP phosphodiesterase
MFRVAHISDPHISRQYYREHIKSLKMLLRSIVEAGVDHIVITGDIVSTGNEDDFYLAREIFAKLDLLHSERLTVVPGNHDIFGGPHRAVDVLSFPQHIRSVDYRKNMKLFLQAFAETFSGVRHLSTQSVFPFLKQAGPFNIFGLNSIPPWSLRRNILGTNGCIDELQATALQTVIDTGGEQDRVNVVLLHHHFHELVKEDVVSSDFWRKVESRTMRLRKRRKLIRLFNELKIRYVLHGHIHVNETYEREGILFANGAGAVCDDPVRYLKYNVLEYNDGFCAMRMCQLPIPYQESTVKMALQRYRKPLHLPEYALRLAE